MWCRRLVAAGTTMRAGAGMMPGASPAATAVRSAGVGAGISVPAAAPAEAVRARRGAGRRVRDAVDPPPPPPLGLVVPPREADGPVVRPGATATTGRDVLVTVGMDDAELVLPPVLA
ncbi:MAG TPA: hypothetical protein VLP43_06565 [Solirubrobacteraceae bacterium]|nr:hypothetical protein [Solirubrobacteraceae bacterium]